MLNRENSGNRWPGSQWRIGAATLRRGTRFWGLLVAAALAGLAIHQFLLCVVIIRGESIAPNFSEGQVCLVDRVAGQLTRGDVVIIDDGQGLSIKRVVGLPNESLLFQRGHVYVTGRELREPYLHRGTTTYPVFQTRMALGREQYFVMGDNRSHSEDSRVYGHVREGSIRGRVMQGWGVPSSPPLALVSSRTEASEPRADVRSSASDSVPKLETASVLTD